MGRKLIYAATSDWHTQRGAWSKMPKIQGDSYFGLSQLVDFCTKNKIPLIGAGDLIDVNRPDAHTLDAIFWQMDRMQDVLVPVFFTQGQHEKSYPPFLSLHQWPTHLDGLFLDPCRSEIAGRSIFGVDHRHGDQLQERLGKIPSGVDILVCHQVWEEFMGVGTEGSLTKIPHAGTVITGDFHRHRKIEMTGASGQSMVVLSPGAVCQQDISEPKEHFFWAAYDDGSFESIPLKSRQVFDVIIQNDGDLEIFLSKSSEVVSAILSPQVGVPPEIATNIAYIQFHTTIPDVYRRILGVLDGKAHIFWKPIRPDDQVVVYEESERDVLVHRGLEGCLELATDKTGPVYASVMRLLRSASPKSELIGMETEFTGK